MRRLYLLCLSFMFSACSHAEQAGMYKGYELPPYTVLKADGDVELRHYAPQLVAEVTMEGDRNQSVRQGFRALASYIFGGNAQNTKVAMTTPVTQIQEENHWKVRFGMPKEYTAKTLPTPTTGGIAFSTTTPAKMLALRFSGFASDAAIAKHIDDLKTYAAKHKLTLRGNPVIAYYDDPFTLPWNRRNEILFTLQ